jgi:hypothetical protein
MFQSQSHFSLSCFLGFLITSFRPSPVVMGQEARVGKGTVRHGQSERQQGQIQVFNTAALDSLSFATQSGIVPQG